jgi:hypothetical protein
MNNAVLFFQFVSTPVDSGHVRFFYERPYLRRNMDKFFLADYISYDQQLCDFIKSDLVQENFTCLNSSK